jgi:hypothetical protein
MVMSTEPQGTDDNIEVIEPVVPEVETQEEAPTEVVTTEAPAEDAPIVEGEAVTTTESTAQVETPPIATPSEPQIDQQAIRELQERRMADQQREWQERIGRSARAYQQKLEEEGMMPDHARNQARRFIQDQQKMKKQEQETAEMLGYIQGKQAAAIHYMKQHGLADKQMLDDFISLQMAETPAQMEQEAKRIRETRALKAENARLKQGRVAPQTFDNSQGSAEVTTNQDRLLEAYIRGDRSEAAVKAAQRLATGS